MPTVVVELSGDEARLLASLKKVIDQNKRTEDSFKNSGEAAKKAGNDSVKASQDSADAIAKAARDSEAANKKAAEEIYKQHAAMLKRKEDDTRAEAIREAKDVVRQAKLAIDQTDRELKNSASKRQKLSQQNAEAEVVGVKQIITQIGLIGGAIGIASKGWAVFKEAREKAMNSLESNSNEDRNLVQVSENPEDLKGMMDRADNAAAATGIDRKAARRVLFKARSEGFESSYEGIMASESVLNPEAAAVVAGRIPALYQKKIGAMESVSMTLKAAKTSNLDFEQLATTMPQAAEGGTLAGASPEELMASQAVLANRFKSGDVSADRIKAFGTKVGIDPRLQGLGIIGAHQRLQAMPEDERKDFLGESQELNTVYQVIQEEMQNIVAMKAELEADRKAFNAGGGMLRDQVKIAESNQTIQAVAEVRRSKVKAEIDNEKNLGKRGANAEVSKNMTQSILERRDADGVDRYATSAASGLIEMSGMANNRSSAWLGSMIGESFVNNFTGRTVMGPMRSIVSGAQVIAEKKASDKSKANMILGDEPAPAAAIVAEPVKVKNAGFISELQKERSKVQAKVKKLEEKEEITPTEAVQIKEAERNVSIYQTQVGRLGGRDDFQAQGVKLKLEKAQAKLSDVRKSATLDDDEKSDLKSKRDQVAQFDSRILDLQREDSRAMQTEMQRQTNIMEKTNDLLGQIVDKSATTLATPSPQAIRSQNSLDK